MKIQSVEEEKYTKNNTLKEESKENELEEKTNKELKEI